MRDCAVTTVDEREIPEQWRAASLSQLQSPSEELRKYFPGCYYRDSDFCVLDDERDSGGEFVDLSLNPEKFTGYAGQAAHRVWRAIYEENCFGLSEKDFLPSSTVADEDYFDPTATSNFNRLGLTPLGEKALQHEKEEVCLEKKVYYRIISGLHASISTHICHETLDQKTGQWYPSLQCFIDRIASHPERLQHIYFNTVLLLRAVSRAGKYLEAYDVSLEGDGGSPRLLKEVIDMAGNIPSFDETALFQGEDANILKEEFKNHFRNVTRIMDCVGCDKCRLWGKIQTSGVGTALKILFELDEKALDPKLNPHLLQRSEVVALVNTLHRFSESLEAVDEFRKMWAARSRPSTSIPSVEPGTQSIEETRASSFPSSTESPPTASSPSTDNSNLSARILDACKKGTSNCLDFGARMVDGVANVFKVGGKEDLPRNEL
ncbi:hypothetical protein FRC02_011282 [Tulasnella sp. 418]|nr:hypothetical protein FRC02_011282 [Tulasnella sp. 418]